MNTPPVFGIPEVLSVICASCAVCVDVDTETGKPVNALRGNLVRMLMLTSKSFYHAVRGLLLGWTCENCAVREKTLNCLKCLLFAACTTKSHSLRPDIAVCIRLSSAYTSRCAYHWQSLARKFMSGCRVYMTVELAASVFFKCNTAALWFESFYQNGGKSYFAEFKFERLSVVSAARHPRTSVAFPAFCDFMKLVSERARCLELCNVELNGPFGDFVSDQASFVGGPYERLVLSIATSFYRISKYQWAKISSIRDLCIVDFGSPFEHADAAHRLDQDCLQWVTLIRPLQLPYVKLTLQQLTICDARAQAADIHEWMVFLSHMRVRSFREDAPAHVMRINLIGCPQHLSQTFMHAYDANDAEDLHTVWGVVSTLSYDIRVYADVRTARADGARVAYVSV